MHVLFINRHDRPDREAFQREQAKRLGYECERIEADIPATAGGFQNLAFRGVFLSHIKLWERIAMERQQYIIFEDDNEITDYGRMQESLGILKEPRYQDWAFLHFHHEGAQQNTVYLQKTLSVATHAYTINPERAPVLATEGRLGYERVLTTGDKSFHTAIDHWCKEHLWNHYPTYGGWNCCRQNGSKSDMGWREGLVQP